MRKREGLGPDGKIKCQVVSGTRVVKEWERGYFWGET
jgi:hypothetical protein